MDGLGKKYLIFQLWYEIVQIKYFCIYVFYLSITGSVCLLKLSF